MKVCGENLCFIAWQFPACATYRIAVDPAGHLQCACQARITALDDVEPSSYGMPTADRNATGVCLLTGGSEQGSSEVWPDPLDPAYQEPPVVYEEPPKRAQQGGQQAQACDMQPPLPLMPGLVFIPG